MKNRIITGAVYVLVILALVVLKWIVPDGYGSLGFDALFCAVSVIACIEFLKAFQGVSFYQRVITIAFCAAIIPLYVLVQLTMGDGLFAVLCCGCLYAFILAALNIFNFGESTVRGTMICLTAMLYCGVLSCVLSAVNHLSDNSLAAIIFLFIVVSFADSGAYIIGSTLKRWVPYKLAPKVSPNKTIIGSVGAIVGGLIGAVIAYYIYYGISKVNISDIVTGTPLVYGGALPGVVLFLIVGLVVSIVSQIGDLFESAIKRECNIKDSGKLLPGHGGILDRFDSMFFSGVIILLAFVLM